MNWLKKKWQENHWEVIAWAGAGVVAVNAAVVIVLAKDNAKLQSKVADAAKNALEAGINGFNEGYEVAISEIEMIAENKEMQKALKAASK